MTLLEFSLISALGFGNTPFPAQLPTLLPALMVRHDVIDRVYFELTDSARCVPGSPIRWNPIVASWDVRAGYDNGDFDVFVGHVSQHGVGIEGLPYDHLTESMDYVGVKYRLEFRE